MLNIEQYREIIEKSIEKYDLNKEPKGLYEPISYTLNNKGKRIRPILTLLACNMFSENIENAIAPALGLEVFHNFTLLHDDIMDEAPVRRGKPTVYKKWNASTAILSGDAMVVEAYKMVCNSPIQQLKKVLDLFSDTALGVCKGQQYDMDFECRLNVTVPEYMEMIRLKTSVLLAASLKTGAIIGGASDKDAELLYDFGINLGLAFQLIDDWLDAFSDSKLFGKKTGGDIVVNKKTYLLIRALEKANNEQKVELNNWITSTDFNEEEKIKSVKQLYKILKVDKLTLREAEFYSEKAFNYLAEVNLPQQKKDLLLQVGKSLLNREK